MSYQTPTNTNRPLYAATVALSVIMAVTLVALAVVFFGGQTSEAAATTSTAAVSQPVAAEAAPAAPIQKQAPVETVEASEAADVDAPVPTEAPAESVTSDPAPATSTAPVTSTAPATQSTPATQPVTPEPAIDPDAPAALSPVIPGPVPFQATCGTSRNAVTVGETFIISGTHVPSTVSVTWSFEHGDGYVDYNNPSYAYYQYAGTYTVIGTADIDGMGQQRVHCGTVTVTEPAPEIWYSCSIDDNRIPVNGNTVFRAASNNDDANVVYTFDHGDGYSEVANPSYATYLQAGTYDVSLTAFYNGETTQVDCGSVTVYTEAPDCPTSSLVGLSEAQAHDIIRDANCTPHTVQRGFEVFPVAGYRTDRVLLTVAALFPGVDGIVLDASIG